MKTTTGNKLAAALTSVATGLAISAILLGTAQGNDEFYIDRPMPSYGPGAEVNAEPPLPAPGEWPQPEIAWEECAVPDTDGVQECFIAYANGGETYYYIWEGKKYFHYPINEMNRSMPSVPMN